MFPSGETNNKNKSITIQYVRRWWVLGERRKRKIEKIEHCKVVGCGMRLAAGCGRVAGRHRALRVEAHWEGASIKETWSKTKRKRCRELEWRSEAKAFQKEGPLELKLRGGFQHAVLKALRPPWRIGLEWGVWGEILWTPVRIPALVWWDLAARWGVSHARSRWGSRRTPPPRAGNGKKGQWERETSS